MGNEFDEKALTWDEDPSRVERAHTIGDKIMQMIDMRKVKSALEYGAGTGLLGLRILPQLDDLWLVDASEEMTKVANDKIASLSLKNVRAVCSDFLNDKLPEEKFDLVMILMTLHHIDKVGLIISRFEKILNQGGYLVIADLEKEDGSFHDGDFHGHHGFERKVLEKLLSGSNLKPMSWEIGYKVVKKDNREYPVFISVSRKD